MAEFKIFFKESVWKDVENIPKKDLKKILNKIKCLGNEPRPSGCKKLTDKEKYRMRHGKYRVVYSVQENELTVWVVKVGHRKDVYR